MRSDTTNTTEYLYSVSSLGETLEVVVAAVNDVGTGNATSIMTQSPSSSELLILTSIRCNLAVLLHTVSDIMVINNVTKRTIRDDNTSGNTNWTYCFLFEVILHHVVTQ